MSFGKPTAKLRKLLRSKVTLVTILIIFTFIVFVRSGVITLRAWQEPKKSQKKLTNYEINDGPVLNLDKMANDAMNENLKPLQFVKKDSEIEDFIKEQSNKQLNADKFEKKLNEKKEKSYMELVDEINPSHSLELDRKYRTNDLKELVQRINENQHVMNINKFPNRDKDGAIIVVQTHKRLEYLVELLSSLERTKGIENVLLIISSDWYSDSIVEAVKKIKFCQVLHIFFPFAAQFHPDTFPGSDPHDCPRDITQAEARKRQCINADHPDKYGHYREAKFTMTKHHWWWKANVVFDKLSVTKNSKGPVVFLEEDHYVAPDFYHSLMKLQELKQRDKRCKNSCDVLNLGMYVQAENYNTNANSEVSLTRWRSYDHNMGMTLYRKGWETIKDQARIFCTYDDYNWDWTLMHISLNRLKKPLYVLSMDLPRVFHIGECGMHHGGDCNVRRAVGNFNDLIERNSQAFFPSKLTIANEDAAFQILQLSGVEDQDLEAKTKKSIENTLENLQYSCENFPRHFIEDFAIEERRFSQASPSHG
eukprot:gene5539-6224_t